MMGREKHKAIGRQKLRRNNDGTTKRKGHWKTEVEEK